MNRRSVTVWSVGLGSLAAAALAASRGEPVEATIPPNRVIPAAETVEPVLRVTYAVPAGRGHALSQFLSAHAAEGIEVRLTAENRLTVVAPEDAQRALGTFIEKCVRRESTPTPDPISAIGAPPYNTFEGTPAAGPNVPDYGDPQPSDLGPYRPVRQKSTPPNNGIQPPDDGFEPPPTRRRPGDSPFMEPDPGA